MNVLEALEALKEGKTVQFGEDVLRAVKVQDEWRGEQLGCTFRYEYKRGDTEWVSLPSLNMHAVESNEWKVKED